MPKKSKEPQGDPFEKYYKLGIFIARVAMGLSIIYMGYFMFGAAGERTYNKYMHSGRKMFLPKSKPGDASPLGMSWNDFNILLI